MFFLNGWYVAAGRTLYRLLIHDKEDSCSYCLKKKELQDITFFPGLGV